jgi:hypothetical protein
MAGRTMSGKTDLRNVHNILWIGHGVLTVVLALLLFVIEAPFADLVNKLNNGYNDKELDVIINVMKYFFEIKSIMLWYGLFVCGLVSAYHFKPAPFKLMMFVFIALHLPVSIYVNWDIYVIVSAMEDSFYSMLISVVSSEVVLVVCLVLSWIFVMKRDDAQAAADKEAALEREAAERVGLSDVIDEDISDADAPRTLP